VTVPPQPAPRLAERLPRFIAPLAAGLAAALAHPPFGLIVGVLAYGAMMRLGERAPTLKAAFWRGWLCGLSYFALSCWWVTEAFFVDAETFGWMAPFAIALLAGGLALFWGLILLGWRAARVRGPWRFIAFAGLFAAVEWVRGHIFTGFPWNLPGTSWEAGGPVSQTAHLAGAYGLTWLTVAIASAPWILLDRDRGRLHGVAAGLAGLALLSMLGYGATRLRTSDEAPKKTRPLAVRVVQPNIPQTVRYDEALYLAMVRRYLALSTAPPSRGDPAPQLIIWPEGALPASLNEYLAPGDPVRETIKAALRPGQTLIVGGYRRQGEDYFNSLVAAERTETGLAVRAVYDKHHLVPFGEYVPKFLVAVGLQQLVPIGAFTPGPKPEPIDLGLVRVQPLICYEALFPGYTARGAGLSRRPAQMIVNISNDSWFGRTSGPWQHHNQARYRAIEEALPMARATPTGISSVIDKYGRIAPGDRVSHGRQDFIDSTVHIDYRQDVATLNDVHPMAPYTWLKHWAFLGMLTLSCVVGLSFCACIQKKFVT
jgi:apolipoprotein N-acyltransferase